MKKIKKKRKKVNSHTKYVYNTYPSIIETIFNKAIFMV